MVAKLLVALALSLVSVSCAAQAVPQVTHRTPLATSLGVGMDYMSGDWGSANINRWGPSAWGTLTIWHDLSIIAEGHSMIVGGNQAASDYKYFTGGGGLVYTSDYWGRFQPLFKGEAGFASLSHPPNLSGHLHDTRTIWTFGAGVEYHTVGQWWTRVEYDYDFFPDFHGTTGQNHTLNPRGIIFGETFRFGPSGSRF
ncbi:MAG TPA: outer membrane beta-barrel protein [Terracidiphilus sp.]